MLKSSSNCNYNIPLILSVTFPELTSISLTFFGHRVDFAIEKVFYSFTR
jgi:hypothetical protein